jgi:hypothetical protein
MQTREEHLALCKKTALEYLDRGDMDNAVIYMLSDLSKHPETEKVSLHMTLFGIHLLTSQRDPKRIRRFIEVFN